MFAVPDYGGLRRGRGSARRHNDLRRRLSSLIACRHHYSWWCPHGGGVSAGLSGRQEQNRRLMKCPRLALTWSNTLAATVAGAACSGVARNFTVV